MAAILNFDIYTHQNTKNDARNGLSMPHIAGKVILHGFLWTFTFKLHFQYGHRRPSWILMFGLVKIQKRCQKWILHAKIDRKSGFTQLSISICFQRAQIKCQTLLCSQWSRDPQIAPNYMYLTLWGIGIHTVNNLVEIITTRAINYYSEVTMGQGTSRSLKS